MGLQAAPKLNKLLYHQGKPFFEWRREALIQREIVRSLQKEKNLTRELLLREAAFLAGVIEARGILSIHSDERREQLLPFLAIDSYDKAFLENTEKLIGHGSVIVKRQTSKRICWRFTINDAEGIMLLLGQVIPQLYLLKERAKILFNFCARRLESPSFATEDWEAYQKLGKRGD